MQQNDILVENFCQPQYGHTYYYHATKYYQTFVFTTIQRKINIFFHKQLETNIEENLSTADDNKFRIAIHNLGNSSLLFV